MITHYVPQWLLDQFRERKLFELDKGTGQIAVRSLRKAGSGDDIWPEEIERELMTPHDTKAHRIFRTRIVGHDKVVLGPDDRLEFATWLALFMPRVPYTLANLRQMSDDVRTNPNVPIELLMERKAEVLAVIRKNHPTLYSEFVKEWGQAFAEGWLLAALRRMIRNGEITCAPDPERAYHAHLRITEVPAFAAILSRYQWFWLRTRHRFIIGDNPLVRWHEKSKRWNYGIKRRGVEISIPLTNRLCLLMRKRHVRYDGRLIVIGQNLTRQLNHRQRMAALGKVYAGNPVLLNSDAAHGFY